MSQLSHAGQHVQEKIGVLSHDCEVVRTHFQGSVLFKSYSLSYHNDCDAFYWWLVTERPRLVVLQASFLQAISDEKKTLLKEALSTWHIMTVMVCENVQQIRSWRAQDWPSLHFWSKDINDDFRQRVFSLLNERLLLDKPFVYVLSDAPHFISQVGVLLSYYGIRFCVVKERDRELMAKNILADGPEALLWDGATGLEKPHVFYEEIHQFYGKKKNPIFLFDLEEKSKPFWWGKLKDCKVYQSLKTDHFMPDLLEHIYQKRNEKMKLCRDFSSGLYLIDTFHEVVSKEIPVALSRGEEFSILKISIHDLPEITEKFGVIFANNLVANLGLFVKNHVRSTDFVACGEKPGEALVFFQCLGAPLAKLVGKRLMAEFAKKMSFEDETYGTFNPGLFFEAISFPHEIQCQEQLDLFLNRKFLGKGGGIEMEVFT